MGHIRDILFGAILASLMLLPFLTYTGIILPTPYKDVEINKIRVEPVTSSIYFSANFVKNDSCKFAELAVFTRELGIWNRVPWQDAKGIDHGDRIAGNQTIELLIPVSPIADLVEIRTRHQCGVAKVDKIFASFKPESRD